MLRLTIHRSRTPASRKETHTHKSPNSRQNGSLRENTYRSTRKNNEQSTNHNYMNLRRLASPEVRTYVLSEAAFAVQRLAAHHLQQAWLKTELVIA